MFWIPNHQILLPSQDCDDGEAVTAQNQVVCTLLCHDRQKVNGAELRCDEAEIGTRHQSLGRLPNTEQSLDRAVGEAWEGLEVGPTPNTVASLTNS